MTPKSFDIPDIPDIPGLDDDDAGAGGSRGRSRRGGGSGGGRRRRWPWLLSGIVLGVLGTLFLPGLLRPYLPAALRGRTTRVEGLVVEKGKEGSRLLLTVDTQEGAMLATFDKKVPEIDLLVARGDSVTLGVPTYRPFVQEPELLGVKKFPGGAPRTGGGVAAPAQGAAGPGAPTSMAPDTQPGRDTTPSSDSTAGEESR
ncbi:MAG: hypothetical protein Q8W49_00595 [Candidatus Palauibacterales bacterium]|nr:hypothetical protein [Candidatus Palauibacterales bacterium]